jgi:hypothetical protein
MRFMVMHKVTAETETGLPPDAATMDAIHGLIGEAIQAGSFLGGEGLKPTRERLRLDYRDGRRTVTEGPFVDATQLPAGFAVLHVRARDEAVACCDRLAAARGEGALWLGPVHEPWDLGMGDRPADAPLRFLAMPEADARSEVELAPDPTIAARIAALEAAMREEGVLAASGALTPTRRGARVRLGGGKPTIIDGPFAESKELVSGYGILELPSLASAIDFAIRFARVVRVDEVDLRPLAD